LDLGTKTIGLAVSDLGFSFANPRHAGCASPFEGARDG
jgi:RNase H-fold protein (predicted Holliday junction resolvase)